MEPKTSDLLNEMMEVIHRFIMVLESTDLNNEKGTPIRVGGKVYTVKCRKPMWHDVENRTYKTVTLSIRRFPCGDDQNFTTNFYVSEFVADIESNKVRFSHVKTIIRMNEENPQHDLFLTNIVTDMNSWIPTTFKFTPDYVNKNTYIASICEITNGNASIEDVFNFPDQPPVVDFDKWYEVPEDEDEVAKVA